tara:strand:+ start:844 stop:1395 length:552 start_codon:yes stop_codon:yes gene_type:complete
MFIFKVILKRYKNDCDSIIAFTSSSQARLDANSGIVVKDEKDFFENYIFKSEDFLSLYNALSRSSKVERFTDRKTAVKRTWDLFVKLAINKDIEIIRDINNSNSSKSSKSLSTRGRKSKHEGKRIILKDTWDKNPRRRYSHGYNSFEILMKHIEIPYEDYIAKGGRRQDLAWDLHMKRVKVIK